ncbi:hypothetical protein SUNI508_11645 [Seiridium unicorne]|uniref:Rhodopsin domain-containing protein n=1 Tax=Seiridium unicorne TaxID=138068 RepID=A0ABR2UGS8_9PEZI
MRIFVPTGQRNFMFWACQFFLWANIIFAVSMVITNNIACVPYEYNWNKLIAGSCNIVNQSQTNLGSSIFNFILDVLVFFLPQRAIWQLKMSRKKKIGVSMVFMIGLAAIVATAIRLGVTLVNVNSEDYTYTFSAVMMCALGEALGGFIVLCGVTFPKVTSSVMESRWMSSMRSWTHFSSKGTHSTQEHRDYPKSLTPRSDYSRMKERSDVQLQPLRTTVTAPPEWDYDDDAGARHVPRTTV